MQGTFVSYERPATKKALREAVAADPATVSLEATSFFGNEYDGPLPDAPDGRYAVVGPDPHRRRNWYATIVKQGGDYKVT